MTEHDDLRIPEPELEPVPEQEVKQRLSSTALKRGVRAFVMLAVLAAVVVIAFTVTGETWEGLKRVQVHWLLATIGLWVLMTLADGARLSVLSMAGEHRVGIIRAAEVILAGYFMAAVTPFQVGGLPLQLYSMNKWGISPGKASAMLLARGILFYSMVFGAAPFIAAYLGVSSVLVRALSIYITIVLGLGATFMILVLAFPQVVKRWELKLAAKESPGRVRRFLVRVLGEFEHFINGIKLFFHGRNLLYLLGAFVLTLVYGLAYFGMSASLLAGLGQLQPGAFWRVIGANNLLVSVLLYIPTPGASGVAEAGAFGLFLELGLCSKPMLGIFIVLWRMFSFLAGAIVGGLVAVKHIARD
ncbi:MAG: flippase-like domain-containing protein [candidate division WOR-3 bacterium]|nr:MAG: flippase-like domain-containing protein [candidate division WOR-3 bacterium]